MLSLHIYPHKALRTKADEVVDFGPTLLALCADLAELMRGFRGAGISAPQAGIAKRLVVIDAAIARSVVPQILVNPMIVSVSADVVTDNEGCLSFPGVHVFVERPTWVTVRAHEPERGEVFEVTATDPIHARAILHELEHLDGKLLIDHASKLRQSSIEKRVRQYQAQRRESHKRHRREAERQRRIRGER